MNKNNKRKCCRNKRNIPAAGLKENNIDFDYDKFTEAIIKAEKKITEEKIRKQKEEDDEFQRKWEKALGLKQYEKNNIKNRFLRIFNILIGIITFKKENVVGEHGIYVLFKLLSSFLLGAYQFVLYYFSIAYPIIKTINVFINNNFLNQTLSNIWIFICENKNYIFIQLGISILSFLIARLIRIAKMEIEESKDKETIVSIFNTIIAFTAIVLATIAIIKA